MRDFEAALFAFADPASEPAERVDGGPHDRDIWVQFVEPPAEPQSRFGRPGHCLSLGRFAFRYFVEDGGYLGPNSNYIGIDEVACGMTSDNATPACTTPWRRKTLRSEFGCGRCCDCDSRQISRIPAFSLLERG